MAWRLGRHPPKWPTCFIHKSMRFAKTRINSLISHKAFRSCYTHVCSTQRREICRGWYFERGHSSSGVVGNARNFNSQWQTCKWSIFFLGQCFGIQVHSSKQVHVLFSSLQAMAIVLDRETRREKLLENKQRELKLKEKEKEREQIRARLGLANPEEIEMNLANELAKQAEINFHHQIEQLKPHA